jgi:hypothetical protein
VGFESLRGIAPGKHSHDPSHPRPYPQPAAPHPPPTLNAHRFLHRIGQLEAGLSKAAIDADEIRRQQGAERDTFKAQLVQVRLRGRTSHWAHAQHIGAEGRELDF